MDNAPPSATSHSTACGRGWVPVSRDIGLPDDRERVLREELAKWGLELADGLEEILPETGDSQRALCASGTSVAGGGAQVSDPDFAGVRSLRVPLHHSSNGPPPRAGEEFVQHNAFTPARRVLFLEALAEAGNVRGAARCVGVSPETAYKARRRDPLLAGAWDAALVLARVHCEQVLAERALHGVEEQVFYHGEVVATRRRFDSRLLLAHLARLDARAAEPLAQERAGRFDELLAQVGGLEWDGAMADFDDAELQHVADPLLPAARERHCEICADDAAVDLLNAAALAEAGEDPDEELEADPVDAAREAARLAAGAQWTAWREAAFGHVDRLCGELDGDLAEAAGAEGAEAPLEVKGMGPEIFARTVSTPSTLPGNPWPAARPKRASIRVEFGCILRTGRARRPKHRAPGTMERCP